MIPFNKYIIEPALRVEPNDRRYLKTITKYIIIYIIISAIIEYIIAVFFKIRLNAIVVPILFMSVFYALYKSILFSIKDTGTSIGLEGDNIERRKRGQGVQKIINSFAVFLNKIPGVIVKIPQIKEPEYDFEPFISIRDDIRTLQVPNVSENRFTVNISIPSPEIDFVDPLAAMCCGWDKMKKLINDFLELISPALEPIKTAIAFIENLVKKVKEVIIDPAVKVFKKSVKYIKKILIPPVLLFLGLIKAINAISDGEIDSFETDVQGFYDSLMKGGRNNLKYYENKLKEYYTYLKSEDDDFYDLKRYKKGEKIKSRAGKHFNKKITAYKMCKLYKKGGVDYVIHCLKKYKNKKFKSYCKKRDEIEKKNRDINKNKLNNEIESELRDLIKKRYDIEENDNNNKTTVSLKGGDPFSDVANAIKMINKVRKLLSDLRRIPPKVERAVGKAKPILKNIGKYALNIVKNIDKILLKFGIIILKMLRFVRALLAWCLKFIILKGIGIIQQAINLVQLLGLIKPSWADTANDVLEVPKIVLMAVVDVLFFPFEDFLLDTKSAVKRIKDMLNSVVDAINSVINAVVSTAESALNTIKEYWEGVKREAENLGKAALNAAENAANETASFVSSWFRGGSTNINYSDNKIIFYIDGNKLILDKSYNKDIDTILLHIWGNLLINPKTKHIKQKTIIYK